MKPRFCFPFLGKKFDFIVKLLLRILKRTKKMTQEFQDLKNKVDQNIAAQQALTTAVQTLVERLNQADLPQDLIDLANKVQASTDALNTTISTLPA